MCIQHTQILPDEHCNTEQHSVLRKQQHWEVPGRICDRRDPLTRRTHTELFIASPISPQTGVLALLLAVQSQLNVPSLPPSTGLQLVSTPEPAVPKPVPLAIDLLIAAHRSIL